MKRLWFRLLLLAIVAASCRGNNQHAETSEPPQPVSDVTAEALAWADSVCRSLTPRQKAAQLFMPALFARDDYWTLRQIQEYADSCMGGILLLKGDSNGVTVLVDSMRSAIKVMPFVAIDAEWGLAMRLEDTPRFPPNSAIGKGADDQLMFDYGREVARECSALGINMVLGPVVDVSGPESFMLRRSFGNDPIRVADLAVSYARGIEAGNVISVAKHFPGHGSVSTDSHVSKGIIERSLNEMDSIDLYPFRKWIEQRLTGVMVGHLAVPSIDSKMLPAAVSPTVITDLLRQDLGFSGLVITDAINMKGAEGYSAVDALIAGADIIIAPGDTYNEINLIVDALRSGRISQTQLDDHVRRILFYKYLFGLNDTSKLTHDPYNPAPEVNTDSLSQKLKQ